jgi:hypothetical protein
LYYLGSSNGGGGGGSDILPPRLLHHDDNKDVDHQWLWEMILDCLRCIDRLLRRGGIYILSNSLPLFATVDVGKSQQRPEGSMRLAWCKYK